MSGEAQLLHAHFLAWFTAAAWWHVFCVVLHIAMKCVHLDSQEAAWRSCVPQYVETDMRALRGRYAGLFTGFSRLRLRKCEVKKLDFSKEIRDEKKKHDTLFTYTCSGLYRHKWTHPCTHKQTLVSNLKAVSRVWKAHYTMLLLSIKHLMKKIK